VRPRLAFALLVVIAAVLAAAPAATPRSSSQIVRIEDVGKGASEAWVFLPAEERPRSEEHTSELQSPHTISYAVFCLKKKKTKN